MNGDDRVPIHAVAIANATWTTFFSSSLLFQKAIVL